MMKQDIVFIGWIWISQKGRRVFQITEWNLKTGKKVVLKMVIDDNSRLPVSMLIFPDSSLIGVCRYPKTE